MSVGSGVVGLEGEVRWRDSIAEKECRPYGTRSDLRVLTQHLRAGLMNSAASRLEWRLALSHSGTSIAPVSLHASLFPTLRNARRVGSIFPGVTRNLSGICIL